MSTCSPARPRVGHALKEGGFRVLANDLGAYAATLARCYVQPDREDVIDEVERLLSEMAAVPGRAGYVTETVCLQARYFQAKNGERIDAMRDWIAQRDLDPTVPSESTRVGAGYRVGPTRNRGPLDTLRIIRRPCADRVSGCHGSEFLYHRESHRHRLALWPSVSALVLIAADHRNSPLSITEIPQGTSGVEGLI